LKTHVMNGSTASEAAKKVAQTTGHPKRELYNLLHEIDVKNGN